MKIVVGVSGASGGIYGLRLLEKLRLQSHVEIHLILTRSGEKTLFLETGKKAADLKALAHCSYSLEDISAQTLAMIAPVSFVSLVSAGVV